MNSIIHEHFWKDKFRNNTFQLFSVVLKLAHCILEAEKNQKINTVLGSNEIANNACNKRKKLHSGFGGLGVETQNWKS